VTVSGVLLRPAGARLKAVAITIASAPLLAGCGTANLSFLDPQGPVAAAQRDHFWIIIAAVSIVVLPVLVLTPLVIWRYRFRGGEGSYEPNKEMPHYTGWIIWGVPVLIVAGLAIALWFSTHKLDPYRPIASTEPPLRVQVVGYDWKWLFIYPDQGVASMGELVFPADRPLSLELTSQSVMQSFFIPSLGSQIYAMSGMVTRLNLMADRPGAYPGKNTQYNGNGFHTQHFTARAVSEPDFAAWVGAARSSPVPLGSAQLSLLARQGTQQDVATALNAQPTSSAILFSQVPPGLFGKLSAPPVPVRLSGGTAKQ
jgi:cytochrome o ubiquinol oxidase subunit 2